RGDGEVAVLNRPHDARAGGELDGKVFDVEQRNGFVHGRPHVRRWGSTMSRNPSPSRLKQNTATINAASGKNAIHHSPDTMKAAPSATMMPHSGTGGRTPRPMNDRPAALRMAQPMLSESCTIIGGRQFGKMWNASTRAGPLPARRAASTYPASRRTLVSARAMRA